jgi:glycosyltransferase involved in cell wall biosynthesis
MKVAICIPVYNVEKYIRRCLESIVNQTYKDLEIIVVNDCTPDNSMAIVERFAHEDDRIRIIKHEHNKGLMWARRTGYMAASGDYITFCDSDDYLPENAIELLYEEAIKTEADIVSGTLLYMLANGKTVKWNNELNYGNDKESALKSLLLGELRHNLCSKLFKRELLQGYKYQTFEHFTNGEDGCLFYQLIQNTNKIVQIDDITYHYLQNEESSSQVRYGNNAIHCICILNRIRHEASTPFTDLDEIRRRCIIQVLYGLYAQGYAYSTDLKTQIEEQGLKGYLSLCGNYFSKVEKLKLGVKRHFFGPIMYVKSKISL